MMKLRLGRDYDSEQSEETEKSENADCLHCGKSVKNKHQGIKCMDCLLWIHSQCIGELDNQAGITPRIYERLSDKKYEFHCPRCKSKEAPTFLQSIFDAGAILQ